MKKSSPTQTSTTHFEQVPLEVVRNIAREGVSAGRKTAVVAEHFHAVQFYTDEDALCRIVGTFLGEGLERGAVAVVIATSDHAARIEACLTARAIDVNALKRLGTLVEFDARETLQLFMRGGMPNPGVFRRSVGPMLTKGHEHRPIRAYGEMVDLLWKGGLEGAAIRLETLWNDLASTQDFDLLCGYSMGNFYKGAALDEIKARHTHLMADDGHASVLADLHPSGAAQ